MDHNLKQVITKLLTRMRVHGCHFSVIGSLPMSFYNVLFLSFFLFFIIILFVLVDYMSMSDSDSPKG